MSTPFKVKALYDYVSEEPDDLTFSNGQIITVTEANDEDWYTGEYTSEDGRHHDGIFPRNFVEKYEPPVPSRPSRPPRKIPPPEAASIDHSSTTLPERSAASAPAPPEAHDTSREPQPDPSTLPSNSSLTEQLVPSAPASENKPSSAARQAPPVVEKPITSSFKERIAAFNKPAAPAPVPFKPTGAAASSFIKKPFVAPPPSRNAYVPPPRETPAPKVYHREEELQAEEGEQKPISHASVVSHDELSHSDDQPKPTSLKERIALLQRQQQEQASRSAESTRKKDKPRRPEHARTDSTDAQSTPQFVSEHPVATTDENINRVTSHDTQNTETTSVLPMAVPTPPPPARELVSDTNDADDSGAADTEDAHGESTEEEKPHARGNDSLTASLQAQSYTAAGEEPDVEDDTEEDEDPEVRRKRELRERMAKMSGGMGMMGLLGGPVPMARKPRPFKDDSIQAETVPEETSHAPPVPVMPLPGMTNLRVAPKDSAVETDVEEDASQVTPSAPAEKQHSPTDDYVSRGLARSATTKSNAESVSETAPLAPQSPSARPVPPLPPSSAANAVEHSPAQFTARQSDGVEQDEARLSQQPARSVSTRAAASRAVPPPPPPATQVPRSAPAVPTSPTSSQARAPPPPPPVQLPPRRVEVSQLMTSRKHADSDEEVTEYDGDYDTDIASGVPHKDALRSHNRESSVEEETLSGDEKIQSPTSPTTRAPPPPIPSTLPYDLRQQPLVIQPTYPSRDLSQQPLGDGFEPRESIDAPRTAPPPLPHGQLSPSSPPFGRESLDTSQHMPQLPPPQPPATRQDREEYDPYRYSMPPQVPSEFDSGSRATTGDFEVLPRESISAERSQPLAPPSFSASPLAVPQPDLMSVVGGSAAPKPSADLARSATTSRRSMDAPRMNDQAYIACDIDLAQSSQWWIRENNPPPSLLSRSDVLWEEESSSSQKRGGRMTVSRDVYVLYQDYSQTSINATYDAAEPAHATLEQSHEKPPSPPRKDQLESASETYGLAIAQTASKTSNNTVGEGSAAEFVAALVRAHPTALLPVGTRSYGALIYANLANASTIQHDEIRPGDIVTFRNAKFSGHKGGLHQKYSLEVGKPGVDHVAVVAEWDGTKKKIRAWEQTADKGKKAKVREESYRVGDLKSGEVRVWRVMPRTWVNWGNA